MDQLGDDLAKAVFRLLLDSPFPRPIGDEVRPSIWGYPNLAGRRFRGSALDKGGDLLRLDFEVVDGIQDCISCLLPGLDLGEIAASPLMVKDLAFVLQPDKCA